MKKIVLSCALLAALSFSSFAQNNEQTSKADKCWFMSELNLSEQQNQQVKELREKYKGQKEIPEAPFVEAMKNILTPEQFTTFESLQKNRHERDKIEKRKQAIDRVDKTMPMKDLNLTADQEVQMKALRESYQTNRKEMNENYREEMMKILTPAQQAKLQEIEKSRPYCMEMNGKKFNKSNNGKKGCSENPNVDDATKAKLEVLQKDYDEKRSAIQKSRIAPELQKQQLEALDRQYRSDRRAILQTAFATKIIK